jgi:cyanophycinase-like exopeptidase
VSLLVVMGSGETAPTMVTVHRRVFDAIGEGRSMLIDTPYGFQRNADDLTERAVSYFADVAGRAVTPLLWRRVDDPAGADRAVAALRGARWAFAGPGSPTYALRVWQGSGLADELSGVVQRGGAVVFASAAALTLGSQTVPVYEVYKVGEDPAWRPGLDILERVAGIRAAVVPHWDNHEGGGHDTRFCYLGLDRLVALEDALPDEVGVLGVDEHTALLIDVKAGTASVDGRGTVTARYRGHESVWQSGEVVSLEQLAAALAGREAASGSAPRAPSTVTTPAAPSSDPTSLRTAAQVAQARFDEAVDARDAHTAAQAVLDVEAAIVAWATDTDQNDDVEYARRTLRAMVVRLGDIATEGLVDPRARLAPFVELVLRRRDAARQARDWAAADAVRTGLAAAGVELRDTPDGTEWLLTDQ